MQFYRLNLVIEDCKINTVTNAKIVQFKDNKVIYETDETPFCAF